MPPQFVLAARLARTACLFDKSGVWHTKLQFSYSSELIAASKEVILEVILFISITFQRTRVWERCR